MDKFLVVIGLQKDNMDECGKPARNILDWVIANQDYYKSTIAVVRKGKSNRNFIQDGDTFSSNMTVLDFNADTVIETNGYDIDCSNFRTDAMYDIVGISTEASVLCISMLLYSRGCKIRVLSNYCMSRKSKKLHESALEIMRSYMKDDVY